MSQSGGPSDHVLDLPGALARLGGDKELYGEMVAFCLEDAPVLFGELMNAVRTMDANAVRMKAHALKGLLASCGGDRAVKAAQKVEDAAQKADLSQINSLVKTLDDELEHLKQALVAYTAQA